MKKEEMIQEIGGSFLRPIGFAQGVFLVMFILSPFLWIWMNWGIAWKIGLTGFLGTLLMYFIYKIIKRVVSEHVDERLNELEKEKQSKPKSNFQERLEKMQEAQRQQKLSRK